MFLGKESHLLWRIIILTEQLDDFAPRGLLSAIEFAEIENFALHNAAPLESAVFDDTPVEVLFAIFEAFVATQEHDG